MTKWKRYSFTKEQFLEAIKGSLSKRETLLMLGLQGSGGNYDTLSSLMKELNIEEHWTPSKYRNKTALGVATKGLSLDEILIENGPKISFNTRKKLFAKGILIEKCIHCGITDRWNNLPISLQIDHINGKNRDNRIENLRVLCPNCHTQTPTYGSKNIKKKPPILKEKYRRPKREKIKLPCERCGRLRTCSGMCFTCTPKAKKIEWPSIDWLENELLTKSKSQLARELGVSDNAISKHIIYEKKRRLE